MELPVLSRVGVVDMYHRGTGEEGGSWAGGGLVLGGLLLLSDSEALGRLARPVGVVEMNHPRSLLSWSNSSSDESEDRSSVRREIGGATGPAPRAGSSLGAGGSRGGVGGNWSAVWSGQSLGGGGAGPGGIPLLGSGCIVRLGLVLSYSARMSGLRK